MRALIVIILLSSGLHLLGQSSDYIVIKKKNNRTLHSYYAGEFISAQAYNGFNVNGYIKDIRHDSIFVIQQLTQLAGTGFGTAIDTTYYTIGFDYREIERFNFSSRYTHRYNPGMRKDNFFARVAPGLLTLGGAGYLVLELVNGAYRHESVNANNKLPSLIIAGGVMATGITWSSLRKRKMNRPVKYQVIYVKKRI